MTGRSEERLDALAVASRGHSRRSLLKLAAGAALGAMLPGWTRSAWAKASARPSGGAPGPLARAAEKQHGICPAQPSGIAGCNGGIRPWTPACSETIVLGTPSTFNGCGPEGGIDLPIFGKGDYVPDEPFGVANFFNACKGHDCCYGACESDKAQCDSNFLTQMLSICEQTWPTNTVANEIIHANQYAFCLTVAHAYYAAVSSTATGQEAWEAGQKATCGCCIDCPTFANVYWDVPADEASHYGPCPVAGSQDKVCTNLNEANNCGACGNVCASGNCENGQCVE